MKTAALVLLFGTFVTQVLAAPIRDVVDSRHTNFLPGTIRIGFAAAQVSRLEGHSIPGANTVTVSHGSSSSQNGRGCRSKLRANALALSNKVRVTFGVPKITAVHHHGHTHHHWQAIASSETKEISHAFHRHHPHGHGHAHGLYPDHQTSFIRRLTFALMALGKWEGRAVAFVIGCGLGVLLRLFWVMSVLFVRSLKSTQDESAEYQAVLLEESQPPAYLANLDEKNEEAAGKA